MDTANFTHFSTRYPAEYNVLLECKIMPTGFRK